MKLQQQRYGKQRVRVLRRIAQENGSFDIIEVQASILLEGDFESAYLSESNESVIPTDTVKNTVHILAKHHLMDPIEKFALTLAHHFLEKYGHISKVTIDLQSQPWRRLVTSNGQASDFTFLSANDYGVPTTHVVATRSNCFLSSGVSDLLVFKASESSFVGYPKCDYTTLKETDDRILATNMRATWSYEDSSPASALLTSTIDFSQVRTSTLATLLDVFALEFSPSVQNTLFCMGTAVLKNVSALSQIKLAMPNKHYLLLDLSPFDLENDNEVFLPTDEPHGQIEATVIRDA